MHLQFILFAVDSHGPDAELGARSEHTDGDLAAVRDQNASDWLVFYFGLLKTSRGQLMMSFETAIACASNILLVCGRETLRK